MRRTRSLHESEEELEAIAYDEEIQAAREFLRQYAAANVAWSAR